MSGMRRLSNPKETTSGIGWNSGVMLNMVSPRRIQFDLGQTVATPGALAALADAKQTAIEFLARHAGGDWGEVDPDDRAANDRAVAEGSRILSSYRTSKGARIWVITEAGRSSTCILLPEEY